jgi:cyclic dehypoxanthinyl futalosine synthase
MKPNPIRVAAVEYLNARPLYDALAGVSSVSLCLGSPAEVARQIAEDEAEVALMPVAAAASMGDLRVARGMAIGARGAVRSVVIVSEMPVDKLTELAVDLSSRSSVILARLLLRARLRGKEPRLFGCGPKEGIASVRGTRGALVIGDPALAVEGLFSHVFDLGQAWLEETGLPFVFAAWFGRPGALCAESDSVLREASDVGLSRRDALADAHAVRSGLPRESLRAYLRDAICYELGDAQRAGLERFYDEAARARLLPRATVRFFDEDYRSAGAALPQPGEYAGPSAELGGHPPARSATPGGHPPARSATPGGHPPARSATPGGHPPAPRASLDTLLSRAADGERLSAAEGERLGAEGSLIDLGLAADAIRKRKHPSGVVTYIVDRNVNYTNVCTTSCRFCAFYRPVGHAEGYVLSRAVFGQKLQEVVDAGGVQILLQGGLNPALRIEWYEDLFRWIKREYGLGLHALSPEEILFIGRLEGLTTWRVLERLHEAGLDSVPGGGAEILVDRVRRRIAKAKCTTDEWLSVMRTAHQMGLRSSATMMYGTVDTLRDRVGHLIKIRDLQDETSGFTAFFCWDFQHEQGTRIDAGDTGTHLYLRQQALSRILLDNVDHIGASWVTQGPDVGQVALRFGADDYGSVMFEENVVSSAGTTYCTNAAGIEERIRAAGFRAVRRNVRYDWLGAPA